MRRTIETEAYVLRRFDFGETSRIVVLMTRELGRISCLARGAHRPGSPFSGAIDLLLRTRARLALRPGSLQLLAGLRVSHGNLGLLSPPARLQEAVALTDLFCWTLPEGRPDPELFDLFQGGMMLIEKVPLAQLEAVRAAIHLKFLRALGLLADLEHCTRCGAPLTSAVFRDSFDCQHHGVVGLLISAPERALLVKILAARGRELPALTASKAPWPQVTRITARLVEHLLERPV
jgi:DNA repair protein RecO (recombination protein O)